MFKFGFGNDKTDDEDAVPASETTTWLKSDEIQPSPEFSEFYAELRSKSTISELKFKDTTIKCYSRTESLEELVDERPRKHKSILERNQSDLETGIYEGGLKTWKCTYDLLHFIADMDFRNKKVLDLGCGNGLIGVLCLCKGATCAFQDYNVEVLQSITMPNIKLNNEEYLAKSSFYLGDWDSFAFLPQLDKFDYIFTSETIYNRNNYSKLHKVFQQLLKPEGEIYLASKSYYFGVGGGTALFQEFLNKNGVFWCKQCWKCSAGLSREILQIGFK